MSKLKIIKQLTPMIKKSEGFRAEPYKDPLGKWTVGYGLLLEQCLPRSVIAQLLPEYPDYKKTLEQGDRLWNNRDYAMNYWYVFHEQPITKKTASKVMHAILSNLYDELANHEKLPYFAKLQDIEQMCMIDIAYNIGVKGLLGFKGFIEQIYNENLTFAIGELLISERAGQVWGRTKHNAEMLWGGDLNFNDCLECTGHLLDTKYSNASKPKEYYMGLVNAFTEQAYGTKLYKGV